MSRNVLKKSKTIDYSLLIITIAITLFGVYMVISATYYKNITSGEFHGMIDFLPTLKKIGIGVAMMVFCIFFKMKYIKKLSPLIMLIALVLLILTLVLGDELNGSSRWLRFGTFSFATAEFAKVAAILYFARILENINKSKKNYLYATVNIFLLTAVFSLLIIKQPDLSTTVVFAVVVITLLFSAGFRLKHLAILFLIAIIFGATAIILEPYRMARFDTLLSSDVDFTGNNAQPNQAQLSVASGEVFGLGAGNAYQTKNSMSQADSDFIFATVTEVTGFFGSTLLITGYMFMVFRIFKNAFLTTSRYGYLVMIAIGSMIAFQAMIHMYVNVKIFPVTGVTLPLVSAGGTSVMMLLASIGLVLNLSTHPEDV